MISNERVSRATYTFMGEISVVLIGLNNHKNHEIYLLYGNACMYYCELQVAVQIDREWLVHLKWLIYEY